MAEELTGQENKESINVALERWIERGTELAVARALSGMLMNWQLPYFYRDYYLINPPRRSLRGDHKPGLHVDDFMAQMHRPYYMALLQAASFHGAYYGQEKEHFLFTNFPELNLPKNKGQKIHFISIKEIPDPLIEQRNIENKCLNVSNAVLTACDLVHYERWIGGLAHVLPVLKELLKSITGSDFSPLLLKHVPLSTLQRVGYLIESSCMNQELADNLFEAIQRENLRLFKTPIKAFPGHISVTANRWKVVVSSL